MVDHLFQCGGIQPVFAQQVEQHAGVEVAAAGAHHHPAAGRQAHGGVDGSPVPQGSQAGAVAQVRDHYPALRPLFQSAGDVLIGQAVKSVAAQAVLAVAMGQWQGVGDRGQGGVKGGVEAGYLRCAGQSRGDRIHACQCGREVQRSKWNEFFQPGAQGRRDPLRAGVLTAVDHAMSDGVDVRQCQGA